MKKEKMFALVDQWRESGITRKAFSRQHGIIERTFYSWCDKYSDRSLDPSGGPGFIELAPEPSEGEKSACPRIELEFPGGLRIKIY
jgi:transposase-like protein